jgi:hypothetical protein
MNIHVLITALVMDTVKIFSVFVTKIMKDLIVQQLSVPKLV